MGVSTHPCDECAIDEILGFIGRIEGVRDGDCEGEGTELLRVEL